jgi:hypothetical protein
VTATPTAALFRTTALSLLLVLRAVSGHVRAGNIETFFRLIGK